MYWILAREVASTSSWQLLRSAKAGKQLVLTCQLYVHRVLHSSVKPQTNWYYQDMIKRARMNAKKQSLFPPHVSFVHAQLTEPLPIASESIDCVLSNCVINLLPLSGKEKVLKEVCRVLKPGGRVYLDDVGSIYYL